MDSHIKGVKDQIKQIVDQIISTGCKVEGLAFVGYKDWCDGPNHFERLPFGSNVAGFRRFVDGIIATGGGDFPEDVIGGLHNAVWLEWPKDSGTRVIFHIADAPPHGRIGGRGQQYHSNIDDYPDGHPSDVCTQTLFEGMNSKDIDYYFGKINHECDRMLTIFEKMYGRKIQSYDTSNPGTIASSVSRSVMDSVGARSALAGEKVTIPPLDKSLPKWNMIPVVPCTVLKMKLPTSVEMIIDMSPLEQEVSRGWVQVAPRPFDSGSVRLAYYGRRLFVGSTSETKTSTSSPSAVHDVPRGDHTFTNSDDQVLKEFIKKAVSETLNRHRYMVDLETQAVAAMLANCFNDRLSRTTEASPIRLKYLMAKLCRLEVPGGDHRFMAMEKKFRGAVTMVKYTNNFSFVRASDSEGPRIRAALAVAFSHFTYHHTRGYCMVTDLQGIETTDDAGRDVMLFTDPAIHCPGALRFGKTNLQQSGVDEFFKVHKCNKYCVALGLKVPR